MLLLALWGCVHTPPHPPLAGTPAVELVRLEQMTANGEYCSWEAENLVFEGRPIWSAASPDGEAWCVAPGGERARWIDILGQDGPYLSATLHEWGCCPETSSQRCVTWDLRTGEPATLEQYDPKWAARRWEKVQAKVPEGWQVFPDAFAVGDGHVRFCAFRGEDVTLVPVK